MNATQRQSAGIVLAAAYRQSGADMAKLAAVLDAAQAGDAVARHALSADCTRLAERLAQQGDPRAQVLRELAAEFTARPQQ